MEQHISQVSRASFRVGNMRIFLLQAFSVLNKLTDLVSIHVHLSNNNILNTTQQTVFFFIYKLRKFDLKNFVKKFSN